MEVHIPQETVEANGLEYDHEDNEWIVTKRAWINIPSHAKITQNKGNEKIITFDFDNVSITLYEHADPHVIFIKRN